MQTCLLNIETTLKIVALVAGGGFFAWKLWTGWLIANVKLSVSGTREAKDEQTDFLAIAVYIEKGSTDSVWLKQVSVRVTPTDEDPRAPVDLTGFQRLSRTDDKLNWSSVDPIRTKWAVSPGETLQLGTYCTVPAGKPALLEAAIFATRPMWPPGFQWRATSVSLPRPPK